MRRNIADPLDEFKTKDPHVHEFPKSAQEAIDIVKVAEDGIFELPDERYSVTWKIKDVNYKLANDLEKEVFLSKYGEQVINTIQDKFKITLINRKRDIQDMEEEYLYPEVNDSYYKLRKYVNKEVLDRIKLSRKGFKQSKYITITKKTNKLTNIVDSFENTNKSLKSAFNVIGSEVRRLNGDERLRLIHELLTSDRQSNIEFPSISVLEKKKRSFLDEVVNMKGFDFSDKSREKFKIGKKYCSCLYVTSYPESLSDLFLDKIMNLPVESIISIDCVPVSADAARRFISSVYNSVEEKIRKQQEIRNKNRDYASDISESIKAEKREVAEYMEQSRRSEERMFMTGVSIVVMADTISELESIISVIKNDIGAGESVDIEVAWMQQREGFMTCLPIGNRYTDNLRTMFTSDVASLCPFQSEKLDVEGTRICYGIDQINDEPLMGNRKSLTFGGGFFLGKPGSGKSCNAKWEMANILAGTNDKIIVIDPTLEYQSEVELFNGAYLNFKPGTNNYLNPLECELSIFESDEFNNFIDETADYMLVMFNLMMPEEIGIVHRTIINRSIKQLYRNIKSLPKKDRFVPIMSDLKRVIESQKEPEARKLSLALELFTDGAFSMFNHRTNVVLDSRYTCFGIRDVGHNLFGMAMLSINRYIDEQVKKNREEGITTWIYYDEVHELLKVRESADYLDNSWRKHRKLNAIDTGLTHTLEEIVSNDTAEAMVKNSEFLMLLKSSQDSFEAMVNNIEGFEPEYSKYIINVSVGYGMIKHGAEIIPVSGQIREDNPLLKIFNTDPLKKFNEEGDASESIS